jgi:hypothetical protein
MSRLSWSVVGLIASPLLALGCAESGGVPQDMSCVGAGDPCSCGDNANEGYFACQAGFLYCVCENNANPGGGDNNGGNPGGDNNGGSDPWNPGGDNNGGSDPWNPGGGDNNNGSDPWNPGGDNNGGSDPWNPGGDNNGGSDPWNPGGGDNNNGSDPWNPGGDGDGDWGGDGDGDSSTPGNTGGGGNWAADPIIPQVTGQCPSFKTGRFNFAGLRGEMEVGPKGNGNGALVFYWHGTGGQASNYKGLFAGIGSKNIQKVISEGGIIFSVQGGAGGDALCSGTAVFSGDFTVIDQVVACAVRDHNINPRRIYATGCSAGGLQSGCMAMRRPDYVAAIAPNSGGLTSTFGFSPNSKSGHIPAAFTMHGGAGDNVIINFGTSSANLHKVIRPKGGFAVDCNHRSGHCGAPAVLYDAAFQFLFDHPFGVNPKPYTTSLPSTFPNYCQIVK